MAQPASDDEERAVLVWLCTQLPELQAAADRAGWRGRLDATVAAVRSGQSALQVCRRLGLPVDLQLARAVVEPVSLTGLGIDPIGVVGDYICPHGACTRRATPDANGYEPLCIDGTPMLLRSPA